MAKRQPPTHEEPSQLEIVAGLVAGTVEQKTRMVVRPISYRIPVIDLARIDAMAELAMKSRNAMLNAVVSAGLDEIEKELPDHVRDDVRGRVTAYLEAAGIDLETIEE